MKTKNPEELWAALENSRKVQQDYCNRAVANTISSNERSEWNKESKRYEDLHNTLITTLDGKVFELHDGRFLVPTSDNEYGLDLEVMERWEVKPL